MCDIVITELISEFPELNYSISEDGMIYDSNMNELPEVISTKRSPNTVVFVLPNGSRKERYLHILLAKAFIPNPLNHPRVTHRDNDKTNNTVNNLEWCSLKHSSRNTKEGTRYYQVSKKNEKWFAKYPNPKHLTVETLGPFETDREAAIARNNTLIRFYGKKAYLDDIHPDDDIDPPMRDYD